MVTFSMCMRWHTSARVLECMLVFMELYFGQALPCHVLWSLLLTSFIHYKFLLHGSLVIRKSFKRG